MKSYPHIGRALLARLGAVLGALALLVSSCSEPKESTSDGSNTNWLRQCTQGAECGASTACTCGVCSKRCESDADCGSLSGAHCVAALEAAYLSTCGGASTDLPGVCLPGCEAGSCGPGQACVSGACAFVTPPGTALCASMSASGAAPNQRADELLAAIQAVRAAGGVSCGTGAPSRPVSPLRLDARLTCAANVHAADMEVTRQRSLTDSAGRDTVARLEAASYTPSFWAEAFAMTDQSAQAALDIMLRDEAACRGLTATPARDAGVASVGDVWIIVLAAE
jgi:uncharacterized protein YkwD